MRATIFRSKSFLSLIPRAALWHLRYYLRGKGCPLSAACFVTNRCNLRCKMCNIWESSPKMTIDAAHYRAIVDSLASVRTFYFSLTGGEPFLLPDIFERLVYAKKKLPYVHTISNAWIFDEGMAHELALTEVDEISFSLDGEERHHDSLRGVPGSYQRTMAAIELVKRHAPKVKIVVNTLVGPENARQVPTLVRTLEKMGVWLKVQPIIAHPSFGNKDALPTSIENEENTELIRLMMDILKRSSIVVNSGYFLSLLEKFLLAQKLPAYGNCLLPYFHVEFMWNGKMYPCLGGSGWEGGFEIDPSIVETWARTSYSEEQKRLRACRKCERMLQICYWEPRINFPLHQFIKYNLRALMNR